MTLYDLPTSLTVGGKEIPIRTDYRDVINVITALNDPNLAGSEKPYVLLTAMVIDPVPTELTEEALRAALAFISAGMEGERKGPRLMDWEQDAPLIISAVNKVAAREVRAEKYLHWWTFIGYYMEIGESQFSTVVGIRQTKKKHKKLERYEEEYYRHNKSLIDLKQKISDEEADALDELVGWRD